MAEESRSTFEELLRKLQEFVDELKTKKPEDLVHPEYLNEEVHKKLAALNREVQKFVRVSDSLVDLSGISQEEVDKRMDGTSENLTPYAATLISMGDKIREEVLKLQNGLPREGKTEKVPEPPAEELYQGPVIEEKPMDEKKYTKRRRSKFKRLGSDEKWKPM